MQQPVAMTSYSNIAANPLAEQVKILTGVQAVGSKTGEVKARSTAVAMELARTAWQLNWRGLRHL